MRHVTLRLEPRLETERLVLRPLGEDDLDELVAELNDLAVARNLARVPFPYTDADAADFLVASRQRAAEGEDLSLALEHAGKVIGCIGLARLKQDREFGYWLGRAHWGRGLATEAAGAFLAHAFDKLGVETVRSGVFVGNDASLRVQDKLGFARTGTRRVYCLARGVPVDHIDTVLTRAGFQEARP